MKIFSIRHILKTLFFTLSLGLQAVSWVSAQVRTDSQTHTERRTVTTRPDGTMIQIDPNGTMIITQKDGEKINCACDHTETEAKRQQCQTECDRVKSTLRRVEAQARTARGLQERAVEVQREAQHHQRKAQQHQREAQRVLELQQEVQERAIGMQHEAQVRQQEAQRKVQEEQREVQERVIEVQRDLEQHQRDLEQHQQEMQQRQHEMQQRVRERQQEMRVIIRKPCDQGESTSRSEVIEEVEKDLEEISVEGKEVIGEHEVAVFVTNTVHATGVGSSSGGHAVTITGAADENRYSFWSSDADENFFFSEEGDLQPCRQNGDRTVLCDKVRVVTRFSNPNRAGKVRVEMNSSNIKIQGYEGREVIIEYERSDNNPRTKGLMVNESDNIITVRPSVNNMVSALTNIRVPQNTMMVVQVIRGNVEVKNLLGNVEVNTTQGEVYLYNVGGSAIVNTTDGDIRAQFARLSSTVNFVTLNGDVDLKLPNDSRANVVLKSLMGDTHSDFLVNSMHKIRTTNTRQVQGAINGGGIPVFITTLNGDVTLTKKN